MKGDYITMISGQAIDPGFADGERHPCFTHYKLLDHTTLNMIDCLKCPKCGHSETVVLER